MSRVCISGPRPPGSSHWSFSALVYAVLSPGKRAWRHAGGPGKMGVMDIRPARMQDVPEIAVVHVRSWQAAYRGLLPQAYLDGLDPAQRIGQWERHAAQAAGRAGGSMYGRQYWPVSFRDRRHSAELVRLVARTPRPAGSPLRWARGGAAWLVSARWPGASRRPAHPVRTRAGIRRRRSPRAGRAGRWRPARRARAGRSGPT
jgi:hypothetical protein